MYAYNNNNNNNKIFHTFQAHAYTPVSSCDDNDDDYDLRLLFAFIVFFHFHFHFHFFFHSVDVTAPIAIIDIVAAAVVLRNIDGKCIIFLSFFLLLESASERAKNSRLDLLLCNMEKTRYEIIK